ncbi:MAG: hypothetical protein HQL82_10715 [Magnetococcales bacterium]|nr:hypothetical protein [Magnetococcales bacterium]
MFITVDADTEGYFLMHHGQMMVKGLTREEAFDAALHVEVLHDAPRGGDAWWPNRGGRIGVSASSRSAAAG